MKPTEYVFVLSDGSRRYEIVTSRRDVPAFVKMYHAMLARPLAVDDDEALTSWIRHHPGAHTALGTLFHTQSEPDQPRFFRSD